MKYLYNIEEEKRTFFNIHFVFCMILIPFIWKWYPVHSVLWNALFALICMWRCYLRFCSARFHVSGFLSKLWRQTVKNSPVLPYWIIIISKRKMTRCRIQSWNLLMSCFSSVLFEFFNTFILICETKLVIYQIG